MEGNNGFRKSSKAISINYWARNIYSFFLNLHHPKCSPLVTCSHLNVNLNKLKFNEIKIPVPWSHGPHLKYSVATAKILDDTNYFHHHRMFYWTGRYSRSPSLKERSNAFILSFYLSTNALSLVEEVTHLQASPDLVLFKQDSHSVSESSGLQMLHWEAIIGAPYEWITWKL